MVTPHHKWSTQLTKSIMDQLYNHHSTMTLNRKSISNQKSDTDVEQV